MTRDLSNAYLAAIVESSDDAIISKDFHGVIRSWNAAAERMFGYTPSEIIGRSVTVLIPAERQDEEMAILTRIRNGERVDHFETVRVRKDGTRLDISLTISPIRDSSHRIIGASKTARDITAQKRAAANLAEQEQWFRITLNGIGDGVIASDHHGRVTFLNREAERLTGFPLAEARGKPLSDVFSIVNEQSRKRVDNPAARVLQSGRVVGMANHTTLISRDGTEWPISDSAAPIVDPKGVIIGVVLVFREITERRRAESDRERLLQQERAARADAESANRVKDDFVALVSHELRTPLNAILGWTDLLQRKLDPATHEHGLEVIARNTRLQAQLISDLLDVSRIVSGKLRLELERIDLREIVKESVEAQQLTAADKGLALTTHLESDPLLTFGDKARLHQIIWNLLSNAVKFTPKGGTITVTVRKVGECAEVIVQDTGIGIRSDFLANIFDRFRQGSSLTTRRHGGLGLGLSITKHLVELHGGSVRAESGGENQGATFTVELPLVAAVEPQEQSTERRDALAEADSVSLQNIKVLVVEDDADTRDLISRLLEAHRASVVLASSASEALDRISRLKPDILVSDIGLPDMDGYQLMSSIRRMKDPIASIPSIALTAFARYEDRRRALQAGFNAHVAKPVEPAELVITVGSFSNLIPPGSRR